MSKDYKSNIYYLIRRGFHDQLCGFCDSITQRKGKDPVSMFWKAYGLGMDGAFPQCVQQLESFSSRKDMQYPVTLALIYFHKRSPMGDREVVDTLRSELGIAEDVTKDAGLVLAARFCLFTGDYDTSQRVACKVLSRLKRSGDLDPSELADLNPQTPAEIEACVIVLWCVLARGTMGGSLSDFRRRLAPVDNFIRAVGDQYPDGDMFMLLTQTKIRLGLHTDALNG